MDVCGDGGRGEGMCVLGKGGGGAWDLGVCLLLREKEE